MPDRADKDQRPSPKGPPAATAAGDEAAFGELGSTEAADHAAEKRAAELAAAELLSPSVPVSKKTLATGLALVALVLVPYVHPSLSRLRVLSPDLSFMGPKVSDAPQALMDPANDVVGEASLPGATEDQQGRGEELERAPENARGPIAQGAPLPIPKAIDEGKPTQLVDAPEVLDAFFDKLLAVEQKQPGAEARILYYGDSIVASDFITGKLRRLYQSRFGDAGHGYAIAANAFPGWFHIDVARKSSAGWKTSRCIGPYAEDGLYGLGCVSFTSRQADEWFSMGTADKEEWGRTVTHFELEYLEQPGGGQVDLILDGKVAETLSTDGPATKVAYKVVSAPEGPHTLEVRTMTDAPVRLFGMRMRRDAPGVSLSALGITGARARFLDKEDDAHWAEVLKAAKPDLVVLAFGTNEVGDGRMAFDEHGQLSKDPMGDYERNLEAVMRQVNAAVPTASTMLVGPPDMASNNEEEGHAKPMVPVLINHQKNVAKKVGWAYFDQYRAMGGSGSMWAWVQSGMGNKDMIHPTGSGGNTLGKMQYLAVMKAYEDFKEKKRAGGK